MITIPPGRVNNPRRFFIDFLNHSLMAEQKLGTGLTQSNSKNGLVIVHVNAVRYLVVTQVEEYSRSVSCRQRQFYAVTWRRSNKNTLYRIKPASALTVHTMYTVHVYTMIQRLYPQFRPRQTIPVFYTRNWHQKLRNMASDDFAVAIIMLSMKNKKKQANHEAIYPPKLLVWLCCDKPQ